MRVAAIYDIHGNLPALDAVLGEVEREGVDRVVIGGDVLPGPIVGETLARLRALAAPATFIRGNGDRETLAIKAGVDTGGVPERFRAMVQWGADRLTAEDERWIASWPLTIALPIDGLGDVLFCHATPRNDTELVTRETRLEHMRGVFESSGAAIVVCGHTHMQFDRVCGAVRVINAGSVGMPFEQPAGAYWALLSGSSAAAPVVQLRRTAYDTAAAAATLRATGFPQVEDVVIRYVLDPPAAQSMLDAYAAADAR